MSEKTISINRIPNRRGGRGMSKYSNGYKWCSRCSKYYQTKKSYCEICGTRLRYRPHKKKWKDKITNEQ